VAAGVWPVAVAGILAVVVGIAVYLRWFAVLLSAPTAPEPARPGAGRSTTAVLVLGTTVLALTSALPHLLLGGLG
jgi:NADH-quinone oxidoreductase subunit N